MSNTWSALRESAGSACMSPWTNSTLHRCASLRRPASTTEFKKLRKRIVQNVREAVEQYGMIERGAVLPRWLVCLSGGKDSWVLLDVLRRLQRVVPFAFSIVGVNLDQGHPGFPQHVISDWLDAEGIEHHVSDETLDAWNRLKQNGEPAATEEP